MEGREGVEERATKLYEQRKRKEQLSLNAKKEKRKEQQGYLNKEK